MPYDGMNIGEMVDFIQGVCESKKWATNRSTIVELLNVANVEFEVETDFSLSYWERVTVTDVNSYSLPLDVGVIQDCFIVKTGEDGGKPLERSTLKQIKATLHDDSINESV